MAKKQDKRLVNMNNINKLTNQIQKGLNNLYTDTYFTNTTERDLLQTVRNNIDTSIDTILQNNEKDTGIPNISRLYTRLLDSQNNKQTLDDIGRTLEDNTSMNAILNIYTDNKFIKELDDEIDIVCKYMPQLEDALETIKDNVLSADNYSKDFLNINSMSTSQNPHFTKNVESLKTLYNLTEVIEEIYEETSKYGEAFYYVVPYDKAIQKLLDSKETTLGKSPAKADNNVLNLKEGVITESYGVKPTKTKLEGYSKPAVDGIANINVSINKQSGLASLLESTSNAFKIKDKMFEDIDFTKMGLTDSDDLSAADGLVDDKPSKKKGSKLDIPGCVMKKLKRENILPIYIENVCLGYYYIECDSNSLERFTQNTQDPTASLKQTMMSMNGVENEKDDIIKMISSRISSAIDSTFINANQDLKNEIYLFLKHNDIYNSETKIDLRVSFLPADDVTHFYFKLDEITHRGISDLQKALVPAKLFTSIYIGNVLGVLTRGQDKRVYYVKQNIETNISKVLLNTINQIKKSNFGLREVNNISNILNVTGRFNDYIIPVGATGDSPIQFEVMQGQDIPIKTELLELLESMAINSTGVPLEAIQARNQVDYSQRLTMVNVKFLRYVLKKQAKFQNMISPFITKLYNEEYSEQEMIKVLLPSPVQQNLTNLGQIVQNAADYFNGIISIEYGEDTEESPQSQLEKNIFFKKMARHTLGSLIDFDTIQIFKDQAKLEAGKEKSTIETNDDEY